MKKVQQLKYFVFFFSFVHRLRLFRREPKEISFLFDRDFRRIRADGRAEILLASFDEGFQSNKVILWRTCQALSAFFEDFLVRKITKSRISQDFSLAL